jgi:mRNA-degrading endonuclease RelE of RelBE toxin-antitoxin system
MDIIIAPEALKKLKRISLGDRKKIEQKIKLLQSDPFSGKVLLGEWSGRRSLRAWPLRIIYTIDTELQIIYIRHIDYRGNVYKN